MDRVKIPVPDDFHFHFRQGVMLEWLVKGLHENGFRGRVLAMPNTKPPILTGKEAIQYYELISRESLKYGDKALTVVPVIQITEQTTPGIIRAAWKHIVKVGKVYPRYVTTNSEDGVQDYFKIYPALAEAEKVGMIVCFHPEHPSYDVEGLLKEVAFIAILNDIRQKFPNLKIVVEHVTTRTMVDWVKKQPVGIVAATITSHHPFLTIDDVIGYSEESGGKMCVHNGCKPQPKSREDRDCLQETILSGDTHFFSGSDNALHTEDTKHEGACGVLNMFVSLSLLIDHAVENRALLQLKGFLSVYGAKFYGYPPTNEEITFIREDWVVPMKYDVPGLDSPAIPFKRGKTMKWKLES